MKLTHLLPAVVLAVGVAACGGSTNHHKPTATVPDQAAVSATSTSSTTASATPDPPRHKRRHHAASPRSSTTRAHTTTAESTTAQASTQATHTAPSPASVAREQSSVNAGIPHAAHVHGPTPNVCLRAAGLLSPHATQDSTWEAFDPTNHKPIFVQGPYKNARQAKASAKSVEGVSYVLAAGLYDVSMDLHSQVAFKVQAVAKCVAQAGGKGTLTY